MPNTDSPQSAPEAPVVAEPATPMWGNGRPPRAVSDKNKTVREERKRDLLVKKKQDGRIAMENKVDAFLTEFLKNGGNATEAAIAVFRITNRSSAATMGSLYLKKARELGRMYLEKRGVTYGRLLDRAIERMDESDKPEWWDRLMKIAGYEDFIGKSGKENNAPAVINIVEAQRGIARKYVQGEYAEEEDEEEENGHE